MAFMQLKSNNPNFSYVIAKNPDSGMTIRSMRKGKSFGWFSDDRTYNVYFKDNDNEISFMQNEEEKFEYLNVTRYNTPIFPLTALTTYFDSALKVRHEADFEEFENECLVNLVFVKHPRYFEFFTSHLSDFKMNYEEMAPKNFRIRIQTKRSLHDLLHFVNIVFLFFTIMSDDHFYIENKTIQKFLQSIQQIDPPFYIRYLFSRNILRSKKLFLQYKPALETTNRAEVYDLSFGDTGIQRKDFVTKQLEFQRPIVDIGCGEGFYAFDYAKKIDGAYYAIDIDPEVREKFHWKKNRKNLENIFLYESLDHCLEILSYDGQVDILMVEVIEHMPKEKAAELIHQVLSNLPLNKFIITTPNRDFNKHYRAEGFRHPDHFWEMGSSEFEEWMANLIKVYKDQFNFTFHKVGDQINGISTSQAVVIEKSREDE